MQNKRPDRLLLTLAPIRPVLKVTIRCMDKMKAEHWESIQRLFHEVIELPHGQRLDYLDKECGGDEKLKAEVLSLLNVKSDQHFENIGQQISTVLTESQWLDIDSEFGDYEILEKIASGGMGTVYKAWDKRLSRHVAIKILHTHRSQQQKSKQRFLREARSAAKIQHANICPVFEISQNNDGAYYIVSAFCEGQTLAQKIRDNALSYKQIFFVFEQLISALQTTHSHGVVHRDLKPENIIVDNNFKIQLVDFGIAKNYNDLQTVSDEVLGTPDYMSPEQFRGEAFDHLSDIWSCGIILYELLEGKSPYAGKNAPEIVYSMLHERIPFSFEKKSTLAPVYQVIHSCLQMDKGLRPSSMESLLLMVVEARLTLDDLGILADVPSYDVENKTKQNLSSNTAITASQRKIVSLKLRMTSANLNQSVFESLRATCLKFRGVTTVKPFFFIRSNLRIKSFFWLSDIG